MNKKYFAILLILILGGAVLFADQYASNAQRRKTVVQEKKKIMPDVVTLASGTKAGKVTFNHVKHNGGDYRIGGPILCIECHHTAQPAADLVKTPPLKTAWPADRTTVLTAEIFADDPNKAGVAACRDCHTRPGRKPKLIDAIPSIVDPETKIANTLTNETAFHQACDICHFQIGFQTPDTKAPNATNCASCHKPLIKKKRPTRR